MARVPFHPPGRPPAELTGLLLMRAFHTKNGDPRSKALLPDCAHGTNPAGVAVSGYQGEPVPSDGRGLLVSVTERRTREEIDRFVKSFEEASS